MSAIVSILMEICLFTVSLLIIMFGIFMANKTFCLYFAGSCSIYKKKQIG